MSVYQRYLSKSLIVFSSIIVFLLLFIESSIGFKLMVNFTSQFCINLKVEEIRGNWRDFTLKNIHYDSSKISIQAKSMHLILDMTSLFNIATIFKKIEAHDLRIVLKKESTSEKTIVHEISKNNIRRSIFIKYPIIFQKIYADKISFQTSKINILVVNLLSGVRLIHNNVIFFSTFIDKMNIIASTSQLQNNVSKKKSFAIHNFNQNNKINSFLSFLSKQSKVFIPFNINFMSIQLKKVHLISDNISSFFSVLLKSKIENNILIIKTMEIYSNFINIKSSGKIIFSNNSIIFNIKNKIFASRFYNKIIHVLFQACLNNKFIFQLTSNDLYKINVGGSILLDNVNHSFYIYGKSDRISFSIKKKIILEIKKFRAIVRGQLKNYFISFKQTLKIIGLPSIFMNINAHGNSNNISFEKIDFFFLKKNVLNKTKVQLEHGLVHNPDILKLMGSINITGDSRNNRYDWCIPKINIDSTVMKKKLSISGPLCYRNSNILETSGINISAGNNTLNIKGFIERKRININTTIDASNLEYFLPFLKGLIRIRSHLYGNNIFPIMSNIILVRNLNWKNKIYSKNITIFSNINTKNTFSGLFLLDIKSLRFFNFQINALQIKAFWDNNKKKFSFLFKNPTLHAKIISTIVIDHKTNNWHGILKKIHVKTALGECIFKKVPVFYHNFNNSTKKNFYIKIRNVFFSFLQKTKKYFSNVSNKDLFDFQSKIFIQSKLKWVLGKHISYGNVLLTGNNIRLQRKNKDTILIEDIDHFKISFNLLDKNAKIKWIVQKSTSQLASQHLAGELNITDFYNSKKIEGQCTISNFPISFINFFTTNFKHVKGTFSGDINFSRSLYHPKISAHISLKNIFIESDNILQYITLFFPYLSGKVENIKINQEIIMKKGNLFFIFNKNSDMSHKIEWNLFFNSKKVAMVIFNKIKIECSSQLNLHYLFEKYDLIGYIKFSFFYFKINEKNFKI